MEQISATTGTGGFIQPESMVKNFDLQKGDHVADFGAGHGYFAISMARLVGGDGKVYAIDIQKSVLDVVRSRAQAEHLLNLETVWGNVEQKNGSKLKDRYLDVVVAANIIFQAEEKGGILEEAHRVLREDGRLIVIEWSQFAQGNKTPYRVGPPDNLRVGRETVKNLALEAGFTLLREFSAGSHHYGLIFKK